MPGSGQADGVIVGVSGDVQQALFIQREFGAQTFERGQARLVTAAVVQNGQQQGLVGNSLHQRYPLRSVQHAGRGARKDATVLHQSRVPDLVIGFLAQGIQRIKRRDVGDGRQTHCALRVLAGQLGEDAGCLCDIGVGGIGRVLELRDGCQAYGWVFVLPLLAL